MFTYTKICYKQKTTTFYCQRRRPGYSTLTQVNPIQVGTFLLCHVHVHIKEDHRVSKVLLWWWIQNQNNIMGRGTVEGLVMSVQHLPNTEASPQLGAQHATGKVRQDSQDFVWGTWKSRTLLLSSLTYWKGVSHMRISEICGRRKYKTSPLHRIFKCSRQIRLRFTVHDMATIHKD